MICFWSPIFLICPSEYLWTMKKTIWILLLALLPFPARSQSETPDSCILRITGAFGMEELDESVVERFDRLFSSPVRVNLASDSRLVSSGLFTRYQAASLRDYRSSHGDVLSAQELALVDGFGEAAVRAIEPFISFESPNLPGRVASGARFETEGSSRLNLRLSDSGPGWGYLSKLRAGVPDRWEVSIAAKSTLAASKWPPEEVAGSAAYYGRRHLAKAVIGDFNARFGQGLLLWSGFSLTGASTAAAFARHSTGISPAWTASPSMAQRGAAAELVFGRLSLSGFLSLNRFAGANVSYSARQGQYGLTAVSASRFSADLRQSAGKFDIFAEAALDARSRTLAAVGGVTFNPSYGSHVSLLLRDYPAGFDGAYAGAFRSSTKTSDEMGAALGFDTQKLSLTMDYARHPSKGTSQMKAVFKYSNDFSGKLTAAVKLTSRLRPADSHIWRNEGRADVTLRPVPGWSLSGAADVCHCQETSWLVFVESGYDFAGGKLRKLSASSRFTVFGADRWDDRIYCYERNVPGAFSVPAFYGRGYSVYFLSTLKTGHWSFSFRASLLGYPWMDEKKPGKAELVSMLKFTY